MAVSVRVFLQGPGHGVCRVSSTRWDKWYSEYRLADAPSSVKFTLSGRFSRF